MRTLVVAVDHREKYPLIFPARLYWRPDDDTTIFDVRIVKRQIRTADYYIDGHKGTCLIERKATVNELNTNLFGPAKKRNNFVSALDRMADECTHPYLFLDMRWSDLWADHDANGRPIQRCPFTLYDHLFQELACRGIGLLGPIPARTVVQRRMAGDLLLRLMLSHVFPRRSHAQPGLIVDTPGPVRTLRPRRGDRLRACRRFARTDG